MNRRTNESHTPWPKTKTGIAAVNEDHEPWPGTLGHSEDLGDEQKVDFEKESGVPI